MLRSWLLIRPRVLRPKLRNCLRLWNTVAFQSLPLWTSWTVTVASPWTCWKNWKRFWVLAAIRWIGRLAWGRALKDFMTSTMRGWSFIRVRSALRLWQKVTNCLLLTLSMSKLRKTLSSWAKLEMNFQKKRFWRVSWHLFSLAQPWPTLVCRLSWRLSSSLLRNRMATRRQMAR